MWIYIHLFKTLFDTSKSRALQARIYELNYMRKIGERKMNPESETFFGPSHLLFYPFRLRPEAGLGDLWLPEFLYV